MVTLQMIQEAQESLKGIARKTPLENANRLGENIYIKSENLQLTGAFKIRGAYNKIRSLTPEEASHGVIACSAGNHAQGIALSATKLGIKSVICMPEGAPISKVEATRSYGAEVCLVPGVYDDAYAKAVELQQQHGYTFVHPFDDPKVIAGQGTIGLEILEQLPDVDAVVVPIGGGGLISGVAFAIKTLRPEIKVYGVQSSGAPSMAASLQEGHIARLSEVSTIADGIAVKEPGVNTFEMCNKYVDEVVTVSDEEIAAAILALTEQLFHFFLKGSSIYRRGLELLSLSRQLIELLKAYLPSVQPVAVIFSVRHNLKRQHLKAKPIRHFLRQVAGRISHYHIFFTHIASFLPVIFFINGNIIP